MDALVKFDPKILESIVLHLEKRRNSLFSFVERTRRNFFSPEYAASRTLRANQKNILARKKRGLQRHAAGSRVAESFCLELLENRQWESSSLHPSLSRPITFFSFILFSQSPSLRPFSPRGVANPIPATQISFAFNFSRGIRDKCQSPVRLPFYSPFLVPSHPPCLPSEHVLSLPRIGSSHLRGSRGIKRRREDGRSFSFYRSEAFDEMKNIPLRRGLVLQSAANTVTIYAY